MALAGLEPQGGSAFSVDLKKASDSLKWDAILGTLKAIGFSFHFIELIGVPHKAFQEPKRTETRWLIITYPLYPCHGCAKQLVHKGVKERNIDTYKINGAKSVSHLVYADDILIFSKAYPKSIRAIKRILEIFSFSWLEVNLQKSSVNYSIAVGSMQTI